MLTDSTRKYLCRIVGLYDRKTQMSFATVLCLIPENVYGRLQKITGNGLATGRQLFYRKIYGYFLQCIINQAQLNDPKPTKLTSQKQKQNGHDIPILNTPMAGVDNR